MKILILSSCCLILLTTAACGFFSTTKAIESTSTLARQQIVLIEDVFINYGQSRFIIFNLPSGLSIVRDCRYARLVVTAHNPNENFRIPSTDVKLSFTPERIDCQNYRQKIIRSRKVVGTLQGDSLKGFHTHIYGPRGVGDIGRFGLSLNAGTKGFLNVESVGDPYTCENCLDLNK